MKRLLMVSFALMICMPSLPLVAQEGGAPSDRSRADSFRAVLPGFVNVTNAAGLAGVVGDQYAWGDYNNDGYDDILVKGNRLFCNNGPPNYDFTEVTALVGIGSGYGYAVWGDYNNDGNLDFFCAGQDELHYDTLWRNTGPPSYTFANASAEAGGMDDRLSPSIAASWIDYDRDSWLDLYVVNWRIGSAPNFEDCLWHNNGNGTFTNVTRAAGINDWSGSGKPYAGMGIDCADYNNDGWPDIYVGNYLLMPNYLWHNNHNGTFTDFGSAQYANVSGTPKYYIDSTGPYYGHTAGSAWGDYNNDGNLDLWVGNLAHKDTGTTQRATICDNPMLMKNLGVPFRFEDFKERAGMPNVPNGATAANASGLIWRDDDTFGGAWCDYDNDGWLDLYVPEVKDYYDAVEHWSYSHLWHNNANGMFTDVVNQSGVKIWQSVGCSWADYNNDGQPDEIAEGQYPYGGPREAHLFCNNGTSNHWLKIKLNGTVSNRAAIGARITVSMGNQTMIREVESCTGGHSQQNSLTQMFGLGSYSGTVSVEIKWPSGIIQNITGVTTNQTLRITEDSGAPTLNNVWASSTTPDEGEDVSLAFGFNGSISSKRWDFEGDGIFDRELLTIGTTSYAYDRPGIYYPRIRVMTIDGRLGSEESLFLTVKDVAPKAKSGGDRTVNESEAAVFDGSASTGAACDVPNFTYKWTFTDGCVTAWDRSPAIVRTFDQKGSCGCILSVRDDEGTVSNDSFIITIRNVRPAAHIQMGDMAVQDTPLEFNGFGNDTASDQQTLQFSWDFGDGASSAWLTTPKAMHTYTAAGVFTAKLNVKDNDGDKGQDSFNITVANVPPEGVMELDRDTVDEDSTVTFTGTGQDTPSDIGTLTYRWDFGDGNSTDWGNERSATHVYTTNGNYSAVFFVKDRWGANATASRNITVRNVAPTCKIDTLEQEITEDSSVDFSGTGWDTPSDKAGLEYRWDFADGNSTDWLEDPAMTHPYQQKGDYKATLTVRDGDGATGKASVKISVQNIPPVAQGKASKLTVNEDDTVTFNASASSDTPSDRPLLKYLWDFGDDETAETMAATHGYTKQKSYTVTLTVTDDDGASSTQQITVRVNNVPPTVQASAAPQRIEAKKPVSFSMDGSDTPNDLATLRFEWNFGDRGSSIDRNTTHAYAIEGTYTVYGKVTDDNGASAEYKITIEVYSKATTPPPPAGPSMRLIGMIAGGIVAAVIIVVVLMLVIRSRKRGSAPPSQGQVPQVPGQAMPPGQPGVPSPSQPQAPPPGPPGHSPWAPAPFQPAPPPQVQQDYGGIIQEDAPVPQQYRNPPQNPQ